MIEGEIVLDAVAREYGITYAQIRGTNASRRFAWPRQEVMRILRDEYGWSYSSIGRLFGRASHCTARAGVIAARERAGRKAARARAKIKEIKYAAQSFGVRYSEVTACNVFGRDSHSRIVIAARNDAMLRLFEKYGFEYHEIASEFGLHEQSVNRALRLARKERAAREGRRRRKLTPEELAEAIRLQDSGVGVMATCAALHIGRETLEREFAAIGRKVKLIVKTSTMRSVDMPIGTVPPGDPLYEIDQQMLRARLRPRAEGGWRNSSLADAA